MKRAILPVILLCIFTVLQTESSAEFSFATVGNPGNIADSRAMSDGTSGYGSVGYTFTISRYAVTNAQWTMFDPDHESVFGGANKPVQNVSWYEATQYCNWLTSGDRYKGVYLYSQAGEFMGIDREQAHAEYGTFYAIPTEDEWYKAAYYDGSDYWLYSNGSNVPPSAELESLFGQMWPDIDGPWEVGQGVQEINGTFNMTGNLWEWTESSVGVYRVLRGGGYDTLDVSNLSASYRHYVGVPYGGYDNVGLRLVALVPEPASVLLLAAGIGAVARKRRSA